MKVFPWLLAAAAFAHGADSFFFIQLTDPQFGMYEENRGFAQETANLEFAVATVNRLKPAFVVITGDLVNRPGDPAQVSEYLRIMGLVNERIAVYHLAGNHDIGGGAAEWRRHFGLDYYTFRAHGMAGFVLNSTLIGKPGDPQEAWLAAELEKARGEGITRLMVFTHHPFFLQDPAEKDQYFNVAQPARGRYLELFQRYGVSHVFAGHYHRNAVARDGGLEMVTTGPIGKPLGAGSRSGLRIVTVSDSGISHRWYDLGELPNQVELK
ncbi:MAG: metallophosphoesterase [Bryobacteraceae bacterium]